MATTTTTTTTANMEEMQCMEYEFKWEQTLYAPVVAPFADVGSYPLYTESNEQRKCVLKVFVQGDLKVMDNSKTVFLTVHDVGKTYLSMVQLANHPAMAQLKEHAVFLHFAMPGQEPGAEDFVGEFPPMEELSKALAQVMEQLNLSKCVAIGEGAGADVVARFAMNFHQLVIGAVLVHCTSTTHGIIAHIKEMFTNLRLDDGDMTHSAWNWLLVHKFGNHELDEEQREYVAAIKAGGMNEANLSRYLYAFSHRSDFTVRLKDELAKSNVLLVTGGKAPHNDNVQHMFDHMDKSKTGMLVAEGVVDVLSEAPEYVAAAIILLCQRHGLFADVAIPVVKQISREGISLAKEPHQTHGQTEYPMTDLVFQA